MTARRIARFASINGFLFFLLASCVDDNLVKLSQKNIIETTTNTTDSTTSITPAATTTTPATTTPATTPPAETLVSFSKDIQPILSKYKCANCHGSNYYNYSGVLSLAKSGQLYGTMSWAAGYRKMPPSQKAATSELTLISTWITQGTLNN